MPLTKIVQEAQEILLNGENGIKTKISQFRLTHGQGLAQTPAAVLIKNLEALVDDLEKFLDPIDARIHICEQHGIFWRIWNLKTSITPLQPMLENLIKMQNDMAALKAAMQGSDDNELFIEASQLCDDFIAVLLEKKSILFKLIDKLDLRFSLKALNNVGLLKNLGVSDETITDLNIPKILALLTQAKFTKLDDPERIKSFFKVVLPELMTAEGKKSLEAELIAIPDAHQNFISEMKSCLEYSIVPAVLTSNIPDASNDDDDDDDFVSAHGDDDSENSNPTSTINTVISTVAITPATTKATLQILNAELEQLKQNDNSEKDQSLTKLIIYLNGLSQLLAGIEEKAAAKGIEQETIQFIVDCAELKIDGITINKVTDLNEAVTIYKQKIALHLAAINPGSRVAITAFIGAIIGAGIIAGLLIFGVSALSGLGVGAILFSPTALGVYCGLSTLPSTKISNKTEATAEEATKLKI